MKKPYNRTKVKRATAHTITTTQKEERIEKENIEMWQKATDDANNDMSLWPSLSIQPIRLSMDEINSLRF